jgi:molecular chaperone DnaK (HSP70)
MSYLPGQDIGFSSQVKNKCFKCNGPIYFISSEAETPTGKPTKDVFTGKPIPLDPITHEQHTCRPEDIEAFKQTDLYKSRRLKWLSEQNQSNQITTSNSSTTNNADAAPSTHDTAINNMNLTLEKILTEIDSIRMELEEIKTSLKTGSDKTLSSSAGEKAQV